MAGSGGSAVQITIGERRVLVVSCRASVTHKSPSNGFLGVANFSHSLILARWLFDQPLKEGLDGRNWDFPAVPNGDSE
jgi:hypothetical protein